MSNDDVPLGEAGRDHYARQFGSRIQKIRQDGAPPRSPAGNAGCGRIGIGAGVGAVFLIIRLVVGFGGSSRTSNYNTYTPPSYTPPPQQAPWQPPDRGFDEDKPIKDKPLVPAKDDRGEALKRLLGEEGQANHEKLQRLLRELDDHAPPPGAQPFNPPPDKKD
jgi:hypothetical protein